MPTRFVRTIVLCLAGALADTVGDVTEKTLLATHIRTMKNEEITVPNSLVLSSHIVNYSTCCRDGAPILHTSGSR